MAAPVMTITNPKRLTKEDYDSLRGTPLYEQMFRNRSLVSVSGLNDAKAEARKTMQEWLAANCNSFYYITSGEPIWVAIESDADAVNFKMRFHDQEVEMPVPVPPSPPKPKPKPASQPSTTTISKHSHKDWAKMFEGVNSSRGYFSDDFGDYAKDHGIDEEMVAKILSHMNK